MRLFAEKKKKRDNIETLCVAWQYDCILDGIDVISHGETDYFGCDEL